MRTSTALSPPRFGAALPAINEAPVCLRGIDFARRFSLSKPVNSKMGPKGSFLSFFFAFAKSQRSAERPVISGMHIRPCLGDWVCSDEAPPHYGVSIVLRPGIPSACLGDAPIVSRSDFGVPMMNSVGESCCLSSQRCPIARRRSISRYFS